jgi:hypothetical protein
VQTLSGGFFRAMEKVVVSHQLIRVLRCCRVDDTDPFRAEFLHAFRTRFLDRNPDRAVVRPDSYVARGYVGRLEVGWHELNHDHLAERSTPTAWLT